MKKLQNVEYLKTIYKGEVKIVSEEELEKTILENNENYMFLHVKYEISFPTYSIINLKDGKILYCGQEKAKPGDASFGKIFYIMLTDISNSMF